MNANQYLKLGLLTVGCLAAGSSTFAQAPNITVQPVAQTVQVGDGVTFSVTATGAAPLYYQWKLGTTNLPGATTNPLVLPNVSYAQAGNYSVVVSNGVSTAASAKAALTVVSREIWAWGDNSLDKLVIPTWLSNVVAVSGGVYPVTAISTNGSPTSWGSDCCFGYTNAPSYLHDSVKVACGFYHSLVLRTNGTTVCWGNTIPGGECSEYFGEWTGIVNIAAGHRWGVGLRTNGTIALAGWPDIGNPVFPGGFPVQNCTAIAAGFGHLITLRGDGMVQSWGSTTNVPTDLNSVVAVASGNAHNLALRVDGTLVAWGSNAFGQTNVPVGLSNVIAIACGSDHCLALRNDGVLFAWGKNNFGQTNIPPYVQSVGGIGAGCAADLSLAFPAKGAPFINSRLADQIWNQLSPPSTVYFRVEATGARPLNYQWTRNGADIPGATNAVLQVSDPVNHQGRYTVIVSNALGVATIPQARLKIDVPQTPLQAALENYLPWTNGGNAAWFAQTAQTVDGVDAARSGAIANNQESWLETSVGGPGFLVYWWMVSSESDFDLLEFYVDGNLQPGRISGNVAWQQRIVPITNGAHTLRWRYSKDTADSAGLDAGFLDYVSFSTTLPAFAKLPNGWFQLSFTNTPAASYTIVGSTNIALPLGSWPALGSPTEISPGQFVFTDPQATNNVRRFYRVRTP